MRWQLTAAAAAAALVSSGMAMASSPAASAAQFPECNSVLHGPQGGVKSASLESVTDCVFDGAAAAGDVVGSTGTPGADCSGQGLPCTFTVTTKPLSSGSHRLCDIAKFEGFQSPKGTDDHSGDRTNEVCVAATVPASPTPGLPDTGLAGR